MFLRVKHPLPLQPPGMGDTWGQPGVEGQAQGTRVPAAAPAHVLGAPQSVLLSGPRPGPYACDSARVAAAEARVAGSGPPAHQNHALNHSMLLHQQRRVPLQRAVQVVAQQAVGVMPALPREKGVPVAPMPRRHTEIPMFSARSGSPEPRTTAPPNTCPRALQPLLCNSPLTPPLTIPRGRLGSIQGPLLVKVIAKMTVRTT